MEIDKSIGKWTNSDDFMLTFGKPITYTDDLAYYIYTYSRRRRLEHNITSQTAFINNPKVYKKYYDDAEQYIRKMKIDQIRKRID